MADQYKVLPMRLFATWEVDRTSTSSVPRLCNLTLNRLTVLKNVDHELHSLVIAVKLQGYKRTLRSNDINVVSINGIIDVDLDISFTLQYPHFIKRKFNNLFVMLQRRKKYKTRPILGFKTLAVGVVNLTEVLQGCVTVRELNLYNEDDKLNPSAKLYLNNLSTQALEHEDVKLKDHVPPYDTDDDDDESTQNEEGGSDSELLEEGAHHPASTRRLLAAGIAGGTGHSRRHHQHDPSSSSAAATNRKPLKFTQSNQTNVSTSRRRKNLKQKFIALLKKFKISEEEGLESSELVENFGNHQKPTQQEIDALFEELENLSDSAPECDADTLSVKSTPKPSLRPYFNSTNTVGEEPQLVENISEESKESADSQAGDLDTTDPEFSDVPPPPIPGKISRPSPGGASSPTQKGPHVSSVIGGQASKISATGQQQPMGGGGGNLNVFHTQPQNMGQSGAKDQQTSAIRPQPLTIQQQMSISGGAAGQQISSSASTSDKKRKAVPSRQISAEFGEKTFLDKLNHHHVSTSASKLRVSALPNKDPLPHKPVQEQLPAIFSVEDAQVPDIVVLLSASDVSCQNFVSYLKDKFSMKILVLTTNNDVKVFFNALINRIQRFCNVNAGHPQCIKLVTIGGDRFLSYCLKSFVETFAPKPNEWLHFVRFCIISTVYGIIGRYLCTLDHTYGQLLGDQLWRDWWDKPELNQSELSDLAGKINKFVAPSGAKLTAWFPIAEAMLQLKDKGSVDESSSQIFVPFIGDVRLGFGESSDSLVDSPAIGQSSNIVGGPGSNVTSPQMVTMSTSLVSTPGATSLNMGKSPQQQQQLQPQDFSPPGSPHVTDKDKGHSPSVFQNLAESQDLQIEYWAPTGGTSSGSSTTSMTGSQSGSYRPDTGIPLAKKESLALALNNTTKFSLKTAFRSLIITRVPCGQNTLSLLSESQPPSNNALTIHFVRERKKDKMLQKLGMKNKEKESDQKKQSIDNVSRLICSSKQHTAMKLFIDGVEWNNVKFFQISTQWQTHVKILPVALFNID